MIWAGSLGGREWEGAGLRKSGWTDGASPCSKGHLNAILAIKGNLSSSEVRSVRSILDVSVNTGTREPFKSLFSLIKVG